MKVAFFSSEVFPFAKTGGLADVSGALPQALKKAGMEVKVFMPQYKDIKPAIQYDGYGLDKLGNNVEVVFIRNDAYYHRDYLYNTPEGDYADNLERFSFFCRQSLEILKNMDFCPDIFHLNDWQTSILPLYLRFSNNSYFSQSRTLLTIHNLAYQGYFPLNKFSRLLLPPEAKDTLSIYNQLNFLKSGIITATAVNTVSPSYAEEIKTQEYGCGLEKILQENAHKLFGIINAIDYQVWDPQHDKFIYFPYASDDEETKRKNKEALREEFGLEKNERMLIGMVARLTEQKGIDILSDALEKILKEHQVIILGTGEEKYHKILKSLYSHNQQNFSLHLKFDESLAHKIYAASDLFLIPSRFEPCGLSQMISFKYATIPLVHATGGLKDTVKNYDFKNGKGDGFVFEEYSSSALLEAIERACQLYKNKEEWHSLRRRVSQYNFSWSESARKYIELYKKIIAGI